LIKIVSGNMDAGTSIRECPPEPPPPPAVVGAPLVPPPPEPPEAIMKKKMRLAFFGFIHACQPSVPAELDVGLKTAIRSGARGNISLMISTKK
jgi:hypothetical protein